MIVVISKKNGQKCHTRIRKSANTHSGHAISGQCHSCHRHVVECLSRIRHYCKQLILRNGNSSPKFINLILHGAAARKSLIQSLQYTVKPCIIVDWCYQIVKLLCHLIKRHCFAQEHTCSCVQRYHMIDQIIYSLFLLRLCGLCV